jgi:hypothetical protein
VVNGLYAPAGSVLWHRTVVSYPSSLVLQDWLVRVNGFLFWLPIVKERCLSLSLSSSRPSRAAGGRRSSACVPDQATARREIVKVREFPLVISDAEH